MPYRVRTPMVVAEVFADEVIAVNFDDGTYYSLGDTARDVWLGIEEQASVTEIVARLEAHSVTADPAEATRAVEALLDALVAEGLIVRVSDPAPSAAGARVAEFLEWYLRAGEAGLRIEMLPRVVLRRRLHLANTMRQRRDEHGAYVRALKRARDRRRASGLGGGPVADRSSSLVSIIVPAH